MSDEIDPIIVIKGNKEKEEFKPEKLEDSLRRSGASEEDIDEVVEHIRSKLYQHITTFEIYSSAFDKLKELKKNSARRYSLREAVRELGPTGYPFEDLVAEMLRTQGYTARTRLMLRGRCIEHEIDVYAYNKKTNESFVVEAKFHNEHGIHSDLQTALSTKARFDDIAGGDNRDFDGPLPQGVWLITNTKFTDSALQYGKCAGIQMVGWNYPSGYALQHLIEAGGLHPVTALSSLTKEQTQKLLKNNIVLCRHLLKRQHDLGGLGFSSELISRLVNEAQEVCADQKEKNE